MKELESMLLKMMGRTALSIFKEVHGLNVPAEEEEALFTRRIEAERNRLEDVLTGRAIISAVEVLGLPDKERR